MWEQSVFSVQMAGKSSKEFGADEIEADRASSSCPRDLQQRKEPKFAQFPCTIPTQPKIGTLSAIKTVRYKSFITRSG
jgi:hypothetical protein